MDFSRFRLCALVAVAAGALSFTVAAPDIARAVDSSGSTVETPKPKPNQTTPATSSDKKKKAKKEKRSDLQFIEGYKVAHAMIYQRHDYAGGLAKLQSLGHPDHPDVANLIGFTSRKLGRYDDAKIWYEKALAADPNHAVTWSYYGMWHAEQGNVLKARDHLDKLAKLCGNTACREYVMLKDVIEGNGVY